MTKKLKSVAGWLDEPAKHSSIVSGIEQDDKNLYVLFTSSENRCGTQCFVTY